MQVKFGGKVLILGYGAVSRCALPLLFQHLTVEPAKVTILDGADLPADVVRGATDLGVKFHKEQITRAAMGRQLDRLRDTSGKLPPPLHPGKSSFRDTSLQERCVQQVCGGDGILNREVDAHPTRR